MAHTLWLSVTQHDGMDNSRSTVSKRRAQCAHHFWHCLYSKFDGSVVFFCHRKYSLELQRLVKSSVFVSLYIFNLNVWPAQRWTKLTNWLKLQKNAFKRPISGENSLLFLGGAIRDNWQEMTLKISHGRWGKTTPSWKPPAGKTKKMAIRELVQKTEYFCEFGVFPLEKQGAFTKIGDFAELVGSFEFSLFFIWKTPHIHKSAPRSLEPTCESAFGLLGRVPT